MSSYLDAESAIPHSTILSVLRSYIHHFDALYQYLMPIWRSNVPESLGCLQSIGKLFGKISSKLQVLFSGVIVCFSMHWLEHSPTVLEWFLVVTGKC